MSSQDSFLRDFGLEIQDIFPRPFVQRHIRSEIQSLSTKKAEFWINLKHHKEKFHSSNSYSKFFDLRVFDVDELQQ